MRSSPTGTIDPRPAGASRYAGYLKANLRDYGMLLSLIAIMVFFQVVTDGTLMQPLNLTNLVLQNSYCLLYTSPSPRD